MSLPHYRILLVEDGAGDARLVREWLREQATVVVDLERAPSLAAAMERLQAEAFDAALIDLGLPDSTGIGTFETIHDEFPDLCSIILTGSSDVALAVRAIELGAQDYLLKGEINGGLLARTIHYALGRKRHEDALRVSEQLNREIVATIGEGLWIIDGRWRTTFVNAAVPEMLGCEAAEILGRMPLDFVSPSDVAVAERLFAAVSRFQRERLELDLLRKDGEVIRVMASVTALPPHNGAFTGALAAMTDITPCIRSQELLRRSEHAFRLAQEMAHIAHWHWNPATGAMTWSDEAYRIAELPLGEELSFELFLSLIDPEDQHFVVSTVERLLAPGSDLPGVDTDRKLITRNGTRKAIALRVIADRDAEGRVGSLHGTVQDITERKASEETLRQRTEKLEQANAELERFNRAAVGRELRMIELKTEINQLCHELGRDPRYPTAGEQALPREER